MKIKEGANIQGLDINVRPVLVEADKIWKRQGKELVVTCGLDGEHSAGSLHYYGLAVDLRTSYFDGETQALVHRELKEALNDNFFDVVRHTTHMHVEYDPK